MGIAQRVEILQSQAKNYTQKKQIYDSYARLCSPDQMGEIYKMMFISEKHAGEVYPFLSEETIRKSSDYYK
jgi:SAM-dependent MidA family methyltransferase